MKYLKMLGLAAVAAMALMAFFGASSASATVLCTTTATPCGAGWDLAKGSSLESSLKAGSEAVLKAGFSNVNCKKSSVKGELTDTGGSGKETVGNITSLTFEECKCGERTAHVSVPELGSLSVNHISGTDNGTVTGYGQKVTIVCTGLATCNFGTASSGTHLGTLTGGHPAVLDANAKPIWQEGHSSNFVCTLNTGYGLWTAEYEITNHTKLYVESS